MRKIFKNSLERHGIEVVAYPVNYWDLPSAKFDKVKEIHGFDAIVYMVSREEAALDICQNYSLGIPIVGMFRSDVRKGHECFDAALRNPEDIRRLPMVLEEIVKEE